MPSRFYRREERCPRQKVLCVIFGEVSLVFCGFFCKQKKQDTKASKEEEMDKLVQKYCFYFLNSRNKKRGCGYLPR